MPRDVQSILSLDVPVVVVLAERTMQVNEVVQLRPGSILEVEKSAEQDLTLRINNRDVGTGSAVKVGENFGLKIAAIGSQAERVEALGA
ncbi:MAG: FliM/FliN family flagellar motor C-terminal domain-containing protein [Planctomycetota bacterium]|nr:FliM/FliN family flagellar motor switch protein [Phycisphaerales bacterium]